MAYLIPVFMVYLIPVFMAYLIPVFMAYLMPVYQQCSPVSVQICNPKAALLVSHTEYRFPAPTFPPTSAVFATLSVSEKLR